MSINLYQTNDCLVSAIPCRVVWCLFRLSRITCPFIFRVVELGLYDCRSDSKKEICWLCKKVTRTVVNQNYGKLRGIGFVPGTIQDLSSFCFLTPVFSASTWIFRWRRRKHVYPKPRNNLTILHVVITQIIVIWIKSIVIAWKSISKSLLGATWLSTVFFKIACLYLLSSRLKMVAFWYYLPSVILSVERT
jgi:hypothetical protein